MIQPTDYALAGLDTISDLSNRLFCWASPERAYVAEILKLLALKSGDRLLDVGCGSGDLLAAAAGREPGALLFGVDPNEDALELASHKIPGTLRAVELHQGLGENLPFDDETMDVVTATRLFGRLEARGRREIIEECLRVLRPGGRLLVADWVEQPEGIEALVTYPWRLVQSVVFPGAGTPTIAEAVEIAGFHAPETRIRFRTVVGVMEILEAFKPLQS